MTLLVSFLLWASLSLVHSKTSICLKNGVVNYRGGQDNFDSFEEKSPTESDFTFGKV